MFYEGAEKRLAIKVSDTELLKLSDLFWAELVEQAGATILSKIENDSQKAFLLSESSLFVWRDQLLLITCGETELVKSATHFFDNVTAKNIQSLLFQRHLAIRPKSQKSHFEADCKTLKTWVDGEIKTDLENDYQGNLFTYGSENKISLKTKLLFMLNKISGAFSMQLQQGGVNKSDVFDQLKIEIFFPEFQIDHFSFEPKGYSINGILKDDYFTLHITPEKLTAYVSFESSLDKQETDGFILHLQQIFMPQKSVYHHF
ncbi:MAG TPA: S-adenosylmethionine decarboxylase [Psychromonas hadalis]|nr:S-adenosylmethionine decarboxylase [Psychromonas hadalis]